MEIGILSIDPGSSGFGWATWKDRQLFTCGVFYPVRTKRQNPNAFQENLKVTGEAFNELLDEVNPKIVVCERPFVAVQGSGYAVAASGDVLKLAMSVGVILECCRRHNDGTKLVFMEVRDWRGQIDDAIVKQRVRRQLKSIGQSADTFVPESGGGLRSHAWDAVGIGLVYLYGRLG